MNIYSNQKNNLILQTNNSFLSQSVGSDVVSIERINEGRNSRVYLITCENSKKYIAKFYFSNKLDKRDRMNVEFSNLQFMRDKGIRCIPQPIAIEKEHSFAIYSCIEGKNIRSQDITVKDIDDATQFLKKLDELKISNDCSKMPNASEACFSVKEIVGNIEKRYKRLASLPREDAQNYALHEFLENEFTPSLNKVVKWCKLNLPKHGLDYSSRIEEKSRTLSPSDFGFHNALRRKNGRIVFLDFEYFGWDDPAKMISDFLLHPNMNLKPNLKKRFVRNMLSYFSEDVSLKNRLRIVYPLFGLKWCLILLNEFLPEDFSRREFAKNDKLIKSEVQTKQLLKAKHFLDDTMKDFKNFPYEV